MPSPRETTRSPREADAVRASHQAQPVLSLGEMQTAFGRALLGGDATAVLGAIAGDGLSAEARLAIYRHHVATTLTDALKGAFPVVCHLVDERFFAYAADRFITAHPPSSPCLFEFGADVPAFLAEFAPCAHLAYLPDVARLEWAMTRAMHAADAAPLDPRGLGGLDRDELGALVFGLDPSVTLMHSPWPVDRIWRANQPDADADAVVDLDAGGACLEIRRAGDDIVFRALPPAVYALRHALQDGRTLADAADAALRLDPLLDVAGVIRELFDDQVLVSFTLTPSTEERS